MNLVYILAVAFTASLLVYLSGKISKTLRNFLAVLVSLGMAASVIYLYNHSFAIHLSTGFPDFPLVLRINTLAWFFALIISVVGVLTVIFSLQYIKNKKRTDFYFLMLLLVNVSMLGIIFSGDLLSFYIFWEIMSWSTFLLISYNRGAAIAAGMKYIIMSLAGSAAILTGILSLYTCFGTLIIAELAGNLSLTSPAYTLFIFLLFFTGFGIKNAVWPFHSWLPPAHSEAPSPFSALLSGTLIKIGTYGLIIFFYVILGMKKFIGLKYGFFNLQYMLCWIGAFTIVFPTFIALLQNDAKRLLAWHSIGQMGYIILGIAFGTSTGVAGGIFHIFNHAAFKGLLFLSVGAVEYRTNGVRDLNSLGGLLKKMPVTFCGALIGACGIIGMPLTNGFVSKWLIYKTLIVEKYPFLAFAALLGTWGTILSLYKFLHNIFLGQLPEKYKNIKKAPFTMQFPMLVFSLIIITCGVLPGIPLKIINRIITSFGLKALDISIWGVISETGALNTVNIFFALAGAFFIIWLIFKLWPKETKIAQADNYAAGAAVPRDKYNYTVNFYNPLYRMISPCLRDFIDEFYIRLAKITRSLCNSIKLVYNGDTGYYIMYIILFMTALIFIQIKWSIW